MPTGTLIPHMTRSILVLTMDRPVMRQSLRCKPLNLAAVLKLGTIMPNASFPMSKSVNSTPVLMTFLLMRSLMGTWTLMLAAKKMHMSHWRRRLDYDTKCACMSWFQQKTRPTMKASIRKDDLA